MYFSELFLDCIIVSVPTVGLLLLYWGKGDGVSGDSKKKGIVSEPEGKPGDGATFYPTPSTEALVVVVHGVQMVRREPQGCLFESWPLHDEVSLNKTPIH